jgi:EAL domain-containing protein (putative c-di-GMP-specific phosphodiesterase class I)
MNSTAFDRLVLERNLRRALEREEFVLYYQPQIDVKAQSIFGLEALIRWDNPELGLIPPATFIPLAEETGLITSIDKWVINKACKQLKCWSSQSLPPIRVSVNLSGFDFNQAKLIETTKEAISNNSISPDLLDFELTETVIMKNAEEAVYVLTSLKEMGISLSVDDFGMGYSSLSYLKKFPIKTLKIDKSFIHDLNESDSASIVMAIIALAQSLKMDVIAEGVESVEQMNFLMGNNCHLMQGYLFSHPVTAESITALLTKMKALPELSVLAELNTIPTV